MQKNCKNDIYIYTYIHMYLCIHEKKLLAIKIGVSFFQGFTNLGNRSLRNCGSC